MQLMIQRGQRKSFIGKPVFKLWAKFELTSEEHAIIQKYGVRRSVLAAGDIWWDIKKSAFFALPLSIAAYHYFSRTALGGGLQAAFLVFIIATYLIYHHVRERILVSDILNGRNFACKSVVAMQQKEHKIIQMAAIFRVFLEGMNTWGGKEIVNIDPYTPPTLQIVEKSNEAA